jgi:predicted nuclease of restriction endonuclease-like (RecB) superfamily
MAKRVKEASGKKQIVPESSGDLADYSDSLSSRIAAIWTAARSHASRTVSTSHVCAFWLVGREIVEDEQQGKARAAYGKQVLVGVSKRLAKNSGTTWSVRNLEYARSFFLGYSELIAVEKANAVRSNLGFPTPKSGKTNAVRSKSERVENARGGALASLLEIDLQGTWCPGRLHPGISWTHYRILLRVKQRDARDFYEIEAVENAWSARQLERQIASLLFERLIKSRDKEGVRRLANEGLLPQQPVDVIKDPYILEFVDLPADHRLVESKLEEALISQMQSFLLELGTGFAFIGRQKRITLEGDHFYPDLVFYHVALKCYVIIDIKVRKLSHSDLGQMQLYVNYYDREVVGEGDRPTIGIILCTDKNDAMVRYVLPENEQQIFASRYQLHLPSEEQLREQLQMELERLVSDEDDSFKGRR